MTKPGGLCKLRRGIAGNAFIALHRSKPAICDTISLCTIFKMQRAHVRGARGIMPELIGLNSLCTDVPY